MPHALLFQAATQAHVGPHLVLFFWSLSWFF